MLNASVMPTAVSPDAELPLRTTLRLRLDESRLVADAIALSLGRSDLSGDLPWSHAARPDILTIALHSSYLDLDEIIAAEAKKKEDDKKCELPELSKPDFVSMAKNFVKKFVQGNFPKVVMAFTILKDAKNDMFVVLCGLFVGLIFPLDIMGATIVSEEL